MKQKLIKIIAMVMVLNVLIIPLTSFIPLEQNKYNNVQANGIVDPAFFQAILTAIGFTYVTAGVMSSKFSIPQTDINSMRELFQERLNNDSTLSQNFYQSQTNYLSGGMSMILSAQALLSLGLPAIIEIFRNYITGTTAGGIQSSMYDVNGIRVIDERCRFELKNAQKYPDALKNVTYGPTGIDTLTNNWTNNNSKVFNYYHTNNDFYSWGQNFYRNDIIIDGYSRGSVWISGNENYRIALAMQLDPISSHPDYAVYYDAWINQLKADGIAVSDSYVSTVGYTGTIDNVDIPGETDQIIPFVPVLPWITDITSGTIADPIALPIPATSPIDVPKDIPVEDESSLIGTVAAILAALSPISGLLDNLNVGIDGVATAIDGVIDNILDIPAEIGEVISSTIAGITAGITGITSSISTLFDPPTETLNLDKLKNLNGIVLTKFPFSIPFDFYTMISAFNADPVSPVLHVPFDMSSWGGENKDLAIEFSYFDGFASIFRQFEFLAFVFFMLFNTRRLIWK